MIEIDEQRVERWARAMCVDAGVNPDGRYAGAPWWVPYSDRARQAIAIADREAAAKPSPQDNDDEAFAWVRGLYEASGGATPALRDAYAAYRKWERESADREAAERVAGSDLWAEWERLRDQQCVWMKPEERAPLDAFVRHHITLAEAGGAVPVESRRERGAWEAIDAYSDMEASDWCSGGEAMRLELQGSLQAVLRVRNARLAAAPRPPAVGTEQEGGTKP